MRVDKFLQKERTQSGVNSQRKLTPRPRPRIINEIKPIWNYQNRSLTPKRTHIRSGSGNKPTSNSQDVVTPQRHRIQREIKSAPNSQDRAITPQRPRIQSEIKSAPVSQKQLMTPRLIKSKIKPVWNYQLNTPKRLHIRSEVRNYQNRVNTPQRTHTKSETQSETKPSQNSSQNGIKTTPNSLNPLNIIKVVNASPAKTNIIKKFNYTEKMNEYRLNNRKKEHENSPTGSISYDRDDEMRNTDLNVSQHPLNVSQIEGVDDEDRLKTLADICMLDAEEYSLDSPRI